MQNTDTYANAGTSGANTTSDSKQNTFDNQNIPDVSLPKSGGAIKAIDEKFSVNAVNGTAGVTVGLPFSSSRNGFMPGLSLGYNSGGGNGPFGLGWSAAPGSITRKTDKQLPTYDDGRELDVFLVSGAEDLVPVLLQDAQGNWSRDEQTVSGQKIQRYRPRTEGGFSRIEKITEANGNIYWKVTSGSNSVSVYGKSTLAQVADPADQKRIYQWLLEFTYDDKGNCYQYEYQQEDLLGVPSEAHEKNRLNGNAPFTNTYLKRIKYGNAVHFHTSTINWGDWSSFLAAQKYLFEMVFDYGDHNSINPTPLPDTNWLYRNDAFSSYKSGFEIRTNRLCRRFLMFHHFEELGTACLVRALDLDYDSGPTFTFLKGVTLTGYIRKIDGSYSSKSFPPSEYIYQPLGWDTTIHTLPAESLENLPTGIDDKSYLWTDLFNDGLPGILTEQADGWYYKSNLGGGRFSPAHQVESKPSFAGLNSGSLHFQDLEADGRKQLVSNQLQGYFDRDDELQWQGFRSFDAVPNIAPGDPNIKYLDLDGDGRADILISEDDVFTWYPSKGKAGYDEAQRTFKALDEEKGPNIVFSDFTQSIILADMSGDGLADIVRIRYSSVEYWPNLGYGRFGAKVTMSNAPMLDTPENFNPNYIKLADLDGSGLSSLVYLGKNSFQVYFNQNGNSWSAHNVMNGQNPIPFPRADAYSNVLVIDLLGTGTPCIVWSSPLPQNSLCPLFYIDLMGGCKPHLMIGTRNNTGAETQINYKSSTFYYLQDKLAGKPWVTKLPFPVQCVSDMVSKDLIAKTRFTSSYSYHHGYFDFTEREFRGFGRVEQMDTEDFDNYKKHADPDGKIQIVDEGFHEPPALTKTWFHTGAFLDNSKVLNQFAHEYYQNPNIPEKQIFDPPLPDNLTTEEWREALRACKGISLRTEVYTLDGTEKQDIPYNSGNTTCLMQLIQPMQQNKHSVWMVLESESLVYTYERNPADPRITHSMTLETDAYGNVLKSAAVSYGRKTVDPDLTPAEQAEQSATHIVVSQKLVTNSIDTADSYRLPLPYETMNWELTGLNPAGDGYYSLDGIRTGFDSAAIIPYQAQPTTGKTEKRMFVRDRGLYLKNDMSGPLPLGVVESLALTYQSYKLALTPDLVVGAYGDKVTDNILLDEGKYQRLDDGNYWVTNGTVTVDANNFYQIIGTTNQFGVTAQIKYDAKYRLFIQQTIDAAGNTQGVAGFNYRTLSPYLLLDINDNLSGSRTDELGMASASFIMGKANEQKGDLMDMDSVEASVKDKPLSIAEYNLFNYQNTGKPNFIKTTTFDTHFHDLKDGQTPVAVVSYSYSAGGGGVIMKKVQAEPGIALQENADGTVTLVDTTPNLRWVGNGRTILNNKGNPVKQYDPYFSTSFEFEDSSELVERGVTPIFTYDSAGRVIRTDFPNGTFKKVEFDAWKQLSYDQSDTVLQSQWYADRKTDPVPGIATAKEVAAADKAAVHANTPLVTYLDSLERGFLVIADNGADGKFKTTSKRNIEGQTLSVTNPRGNLGSEFKYDLLGLQLYSRNEEAGERWNVIDSTGKMLRGFDSKGNIFRYEYDNLGRPSKMFVKPAAGLEINIEKTVYGEGLANDKANNLRGRSYQIYNASGVTTSEILDFKGNLLQSSSQLCSDYKNNIDWNGSPALDARVYRSSTVYDGLNRAMTATTPDNSVYIPTYNISSVPKAIDVMLKGASAKTNFVKDVIYDVKGRRESIIYGNNTKTTFKYDTLTDMLSQLLTTGKNGTDILQKLSYTYDPVGNVTNIKDEAQQTVYFKNSVVDPSNQFTYDALYRLISAGGREHIGQNLPAGTNDPTRINMPQPGDGSALRNYTENYQYDAVGNILKMIHVATGGNWTRTYDYEATNNRLKSNTVNTTTETFTYDAHGNISNLPQLMGFNRNLKDELSMADLGGGGKAYYVYSGGKRSKKVIERLDGSKEIRLYMGTLEFYQKVNSAGVVQEETETLHVTGTLVETKTIEEAKASNEVLIRYQYQNLIGSASLELDENGVIISYEEYYPYGATAYQAINADIKAAAKRYRYTNMEHDDETGMQYHSARYYLPWLGRWLSADPVGIPGGLNLYEYAASNPITKSDPSGNSPQKGRVFGPAEDAVTQASYDGWVDLNVRSEFERQQIFAANHGDTDWANSWKDNVDYTTWQIESQKSDAAGAVVVQDHWNKFIDDKYAQYKAGKAAEWEIALRKMYAAGQIAKWTVGIYAAAATAVVAGAAFAGEVAALGWRQVAINAGKGVLNFAKSYPKAVIGGTVAGALSSGGGPDGGFGSILNFLGGLVGAAIPWGGGGGANAAARSEPFSTSAPVGSAAGLGAAGSTEAAAALPIPTGPKEGALVLFTNVPAEVEAGRVAAAALGYDLVTLGEKSLAGYSKVFLLGHGVIEDGTTGAHAFDYLGTNVSAEQLADRLINALGFKGTFIQLGACQSAMADPIGRVFAQDLADAVTVLNSPAIVRAPMGDFRVDAWKAIEVMQADGAGSGIFFDYGEGWTDHTPFVLQQH